MKKLNFAHRPLVAATLLVIMAYAPISALAAGSIVSIVSRDPAGFGFNDPTPVAPVGGNPGITLGEQRWNVYRYVADLWANELTSSEPITVSAGWEYLTCTAGSAVLGSAGAYNAWYNFPNAPVTNTWHGQALANKLAGFNLSDGTPDDGSGYGNVDIKTQFNVNLGKSDCLAGSSFYLGFDGAHGTDIDFVETLLHELGHGLGFQTFTSGSTGAPYAGLASAWDRFMLDTTTGKTWTGMTDGERAASALKGRKLAWTGAQVTAAIPSVLSLGVPQLSVSTPASVAGKYEVGSASFGPALSYPGMSGELMPVVDQANGVTGLACTPLSAVNALAIKGRIALVDRGTCTFSIKVKNVQAAGALAVLVADNAAGSPPSGLGGTDPSIIIPAVRITINDGAKLKDALKSRSRTHSGVFVNLGVDMSMRAGADPSGRALLFTPNPYQGGSSVSHFDTIAFPNLLMEPSINGDLGQVVKAPKDLTLHLLKDVGW